MLIAYLARIFIFAIICEIVEKCSLLGSMNCVLLCAASICFAAPTKA